VYSRQRGGGIFKAKRRRLRETCHVKRTEIECILYRQNVFSPLRESYRAHAHSHAHTHAHTRMHTCTWVGEIDKEPDISDNNSRQKSSSTINFHLLEKRFMKQIIILGR
jgi:hypothetical protein